MDGLRRRLSAWKRAQRDWTAAVYPKKTWLSPPGTRGHLGERVRRAPWLNAVTLTAVIGLHVLPGGLGFVWLLGGPVVTIASRYSVTAMRIRYRMFHPWSAFRTSRRVRKELHSAPREIRGR